MRCGGPQLGLNAWRVSSTAGSDGSFASTAVSWRSSASSAVSRSLAEPAPSEARELFRGAPYGVGYFVGVWNPVGEPTP